MSGKQKKAFELDIRDGVLHGFGKYQNKGLDWDILEDLPDSPDGGILVMAQNPIVEMALGGDYERCYQDDSTYFVTPGWPDTDVCHWLQNDFLGKAFTEEENERIGFGEDNDKIFILSKKEVERFFPTVASRKRGVAWWLIGLEVQESGYIAHDIYGLIVNRDGVITSSAGNNAFSVFPAMWVSRYPREERIRRINEADVQIRKEKKALTKRHEEMLANISQEDRDHIRSLEAAVAAAEEDAKNKEKIKDDLSKKVRREKWDVIDPLEMELRKLKRSLAFLNFLQFNKKKEINAKIAELSQKLENSKSQYDMYEKAETEALSAVRKAKYKVIPAAEKALEDFHAGLFDGEMGRVEQKLKEMPDDLSALKRRYGI